MGDGSASSDRLHAKFERGTETDRLHAMLECAGETDRPLIVLESVTDATKPGKLLEVRSVGRSVRVEGVQRAEAGFKNSSCRACLSIEQHPLQLGAPSSTCVWAALTIRRSGPKSATCLADQWAHSRAIVRRLLTSVYFSACRHRTLTSIQT